MALESMVPVPKAAIYCVVEAVVVATELPGLVALPIPVVVVKLKHPDGVLSIIFGGNNAIWQSPGAQPNSLVKSVVSFVKSTISR